MHSYLKEVLKKKPFYQKFPWRPQFWKQKRQYGFDEREVWDLDFSFYCWVYERVRMYLDRGQQIVNLHDKTNSYFWQGKEFSQFDLMQELLARLELYFKGEQDCWIKTKQEERMVEEIGEIWAVLLPGMWY